MTARAMPNSKKNQEKKRGFSYPSAKGSRKKDKKDANPGFHDAAQKGLHTSSQGNLSHGRVPMPKGLKVLMVYSCVMAFFYLLLIFLSDSTIFFGFSADGLFARLVFFLFFITSLIIAYGITYRKSWCYSFCFWVYLISIVNSLLSLFFIGNVKDVMIISLYSIIIPLFIVTLFMNFLTLWYVYEKRLYFTDPDHIHRHSLTDDVFIYTIYLFYFFVVLFIIVTGSFIALSAAKNLSYIMEVTAGMDVPEGEAYCESLELQEARDMCFLSVVFNHREEEDISKLCTSISISYYQYTCYRVSEEPPG